MKTNNSQQRPRGIFLLPNLFTTAGLFAAFYAIVASMKGYFTTAAIVIFIAMIADTIDGRIARLTKSESAFGAEYDSLSDMNSFGLAPALVVYAWSLHTLGKPGWLVAFLYTAWTALRLARVNTQVGAVDKRYFQGLPCPSAAGVVAGLVWLGHANQHIASVPNVVVALITVVMSFLMVSIYAYILVNDTYTNDISLIKILSCILVALGVYIVSQR